jgi:hypothetical protein
MIGNATPTEIPNVAGLGFVLVELDLGATFCELALSTQNEENNYSALGHNAPRTV